ncbi:MAG TPA: EamA family transporter [Rudaea sp.]|jgi:DME family drug/metabolite transporter|nr:EamA family transporter [Rudaea sp.]
METLATPRAIGFVTLALVIACNAAGNVFLKLGSSAAQRQSAFLGMLNWQTLVGIASFAFGILAYSWALRHIELHTAQIVVSLQYVAVIALAALLLHENISLQQWAGIALIAVGLFVCGR